MLWQTLQTNGVTQGLTSVNWSYAQFNDNGALIVCDKLLFVEPQLKFNQPYKTLMFKSYKQT